MFGLVGGDAAGYGVLIGAISTCIYTGLGLRKKTKVINGHEKKEIQLQATIDVLAEKLAECQKKRRREA